MKQEAQPAINTEVPQMGLLALLNKIPCWTNSKVEEFLAAVWLIAGFGAWSTGMRLFAWILFMKVAADIVIAILYALIEKDRLTRKPPSVEQEGNERE
jgi:hypothetical protein